MNNIRIVFIDLDGTLRDSKGLISDKSKEIIHKLKEIDVYVVFTTGRSIPHTLKLAKEVSPSPYLITSNGAEIYNYINDDLIYKKVIRKEDLLYFNDLINKYDLRFVANTLKFMYSNKEGKDKVVIVNSILDIKEEITQVVLQSKDKSLMEPVKKEINGKDTIKISNDSISTSDNKNLFYDVTKNDVSKGNAIKKLCEYLNISIDDTMAIGNSNNDIEMFDVCKYRVAVENADDDLKNKANIITKSNDEDGVYLILEEVYKEKNKKE